MNESARKVAAACLPLALWFSLADHAAAEVVNVSPSGFLIKQEIIVKLTPGQSYQALVNVGGWWNPAHTYSGNARNLSIDARPGGCFCEQLPNGGVQHLAVVYAVPGQILRMTGALGPMQGSGLAGSMTWQITALPPGAGGQPSSKLSLTYSVGGYLQGGFEQMAPAVDGMLAEQIGRLKNFADTGKPEQAQ